MRAIHTGIFRTFALLLTMVAAQAKAENIALDLQQSASGTLYVHALMNGGIESDLLLDTGASYTSLSQATFARISAQQPLSFSRHIFGALANGKVVKVPLYFLGELALSQSCILHDIEVAVFPKADTDILGLNAIALLQPFTLQLTPAKMTGNCDS